MPESVATNMTRLPRWIGQSDAVFNPNFANLWNHYYQFPTQFPNPINSQLKSLYPDHEFYTWNKGDKNIL